MGIQGLLPLLQKSTERVNVSKFSGCTVAVDAYCWLHKGAFSCAEKLARGEQTDQYVTYCMKYINMLLSNNIKPILVFDGCHLPAKAETEKTRRERREANRKRAGELLRLDRGEEARSLLRRCVDVTHEMAHSLIKECRSRNVDCIVAPYEADAQLAYLNIMGLAHFVITEDSDLTLFGCTKVIFKMDVQGYGFLIEQEKIPISLKMRPEAFTLDKFRYICILSGCDYLPSLPGIGLSKACKFIKRTAEDDIVKVLPKLGAYLNMPSLVVPEDYKLKFAEAVAMFKHQPVFDPLTRRIVPLTPLPPDARNPVPMKHSLETFVQIAWGNVDPISLKVFDDWNPDSDPKGRVTVKSSGWNVKAKHTSIWSPDYQIPKALSPPEDPRVVTRPTTFGKKVNQSVTQIMDKISPTKTAVDEEKELEVYRQMYNISPPKKSIMDHLKEDNNDDNDEEEIATIDDLLPEQKRRNKFCVKSPSPRKIVSGLAKMGSIRKTEIGSPGETVQSRYFVNDAPPKSVSSNSPATNPPLDVDKLIGQIINADEVNPVNKDTDNNENRFSFSPSPKKKPPSALTTPKAKSKSPDKTRTPKRSVLSLLEEEDDGNREEERGPVLKQPRNSLSSFRWSKPLSEKVESGLLSEPLKDRIASTLLLDTPPNSQGSLVDSQENEAVKMFTTLPKMPSCLQPVRKIGLSKKKKTPLPSPAKKKSAPSPANKKSAPSPTATGKQMSLLNMFGFKAKEKMKT